MRFALMTLGAAASATLVASQKIHLPSPGFNIYEYHQTYITPAYFFDEMNTWVRIDPDSPYSYFNPNCTAADYPEWCEAGGKIDFTNAARYTYINKTGGFSGDFASATMYFYHTRTDPKLNVTEEDELYFGSVYDSRREDFGVLGLAPSPKTWEYPINNIPDQKPHPYTWSLSYSHPPLNQGELPLEAYLNVVNMKGYSGPLINVDLKQNKDKAVPYGSVQLDALYASTFQGDGSAMPIMKQMRFNHRRSTSFLPGEVQSLVTEQFKLVQPPVKNYGHPVIECPTEESKEYVDLWIEAAKIRVPYTAFVSKTPDGCIVDIEPLGIEPSAWSGDSVGNSLGLGVLLHTYLRYDWANGKLGIAQAANCGYEPVDHQQFATLGEKPVGHCPVDGSEPPSTSTTSDVGVSSTSTDVVSTETTDVVSSQTTDASGTETTDVVSSQTTDVATTQTTNIANTETTDAANSQSTDTISSRASTDVGSETSTGGDVTFTSTGNTVISSTLTGHWDNRTTTVSAVTTTEVVTTTKVHTITSCAPTVTNCPIGKVTTEVILSTTTYCPGEQQPHTIGGNQPHPTSGNGGNGGSGIKPPSEQGPCATPVHNGQPPQSCIACGNSGPAKPTGGFNHPVGPTGGDNTTPAHPAGNDQSTPANPTGGNNAPANPSGVSGNNTWVTQPAACMTCGGGANPTGPVTAGASTWQLPGALVFVLGAFAFSLTNNENPIYNSVKPKTTRVQYHNTFWPHNVSIFRQPPSDEVDAAWERISNGRDIVISREQVIGLGKDPDQVVRADPVWGFGDNAYLGLVQVMHQNHCLDSLRKAVYYNYYYRSKRGFGVNPPDDFRAKYYAHMDHCIEFLRLDIACKADLSISTYRWMDGEKVPEADFNTWHQCRNLDDIVDWHANHEINKKLSPGEEHDRWENFKPGKGDVVVAQDPEVNASVWDVNFFKPTQ